MPAASVTTITSAAQSQPPNGAKLPTSSGEPTAPISISFRRLRTAANTIGGMNMIGYESSMPYSRAASAPINLVTIKVTPLPSSAPTRNQKTSPSIPRHFGLKYSNVWYKL